MLRPIPYRILRHSVTLKVCTGIDAWQKPAYREVPLHRVCVQPSNETKKTADNAEVVLRGICFVDVRRSSPAGTDFIALQSESVAAGAPMRLVFGSQDHVVLVVEPLYDDVSILHHYELGLV